MAVETADRAKTVVDKAIASIGDIATLPEVTVKIIGIVEDPKSTARDLHEVIKNDPALSVKVLKVVNSAFYGLPGQVASVDRAIILLGLSAVKNIAIAASIARLFKGKRISDQFSAADLWRHSLAVAVLARAIGKAAPHAVMPDELFVAGLIHDIGTLIERQSYPDHFAEAIRSCSENGRNFLEIERELIGADHQAFGVGLTTKWKFPRHLRAAVGFHHNPDAVSAELKNIASVIHIADVMACQEKVGFYLTSQNDQIAPAIIESLGIPQAAIDEIRAALPEHLADAEATLTA
ncbi:MAG: HDOD domain-containing protein [Planctomycetes bacterium]|nr:HDOD domain-containing protein [Planctomycetota bacterium]MBI3835490.1 HDOD domain-containing protein [Planctomycetota bacterium]